MEEHNWHYWGSIKNKYTQTEEGDGALIINKAFVKRGEDVLKNFIPTFLYSQYHKKFPEKPQRIFVGSMSEIEFWRKDWMKMVIKKTKEYPQHIFQFLTKHPEVYNRYVFPANCWLGVTVTNERDLYCMRRKVLLMNPHNIYYLSIEPLIDDVFPEFKKFEGWFDWVIIGAETGNRRDKVIPDLDWVLEIVRYCEHHKIPVYIKDNLTKYYAECRGYKQFPKGDIL
jgi:protein gp37